MALLSNSNKSTNLNGGRRSSLRSTGSHHRPAPAMLATSRGRALVQTVRAVVAEPPAPAAAPAPRRPAAASTGPIIINGQVLHSLTDERLEVVRSMTDFMKERVQPLLKPVEQCWQPSDFLPRSEDPDFLDQVRDLRQRTSNLPDDYLVVFIGDMITEEALPTYMSMINTLDGVRDESGASDTPWANWTRAWTAEENRHGDAMNKYMYLTGRVNMKAVERTCQHLVSAGMDPKTENNPYLGFVYTSFQEKATRISHGNTARRALECGDVTLAKLCGLIASDEARHEHAYQRIIDGVFERDPDGAVLAFADMMRKQITMPAHLMRDGEHEFTNPGRNLFADFALVAERTETYTAYDYADIMQYLIGRWKIAERHFQTGEAAAAQEYLLKLPNRVRKLAEKAQSRKKKGQSANFSWIFNRTVELH